MQKRKGSSKHKMSNGDKKKETDTGQCAAAPRLTVEGPRLKVCC
jgi:hypothetical protein